MTRIAIPEQFKELNEKIRVHALSTTSIDALRWKKVPELNSLYVLAHRARVRGKRFFGYGDWYEYFGREHGLFSITRKGQYLEQKRYVERQREALKVTDEKLASLVKKAIKEHGTASTGFWQRHGELGRLYGRVRNRVRRGKNFLGKGNWWAYLKSIGAKAKMPKFGWQLGK